MLATSGFFLVADFNAEYVLSISLQYPGIDKAAHFLFHLLLVSCLYILGHNLWHHSDSDRSLLTAFALALLIGTGDELQQLFVAGRDFDFYDFLANVCGASTAVILITARNTRNLLPTLLLIIPVSIMLLSVQHTLDNSRYYNAGLVHIKNKNYSAARQTFITGIQHGENLPALFNELAWIELEYLDSNPATALRYTQYAIAAQPTNADFLDTHGWALFANGDYQQALSYLHQAYQLNRKIYCINFHLGATYYALGMYQPALRHLQAQLILNNQDRFAIKSRELVEKISNSTSLTETLKLFSKI